jgi:chaperonin GroES
VAAKSKSNKPVKKQTAKKSKPAKIIAKKTAKKTLPQKILQPKAFSKKLTSMGLSLFPCRDGVLVETVKDSDRTPGGLFIPTTAMDKPLKGVVVGAGKGKFSKAGKLRPLDVQKGDQVLFGKFAGTEITVDGKQYLLIREDEILGVVNV